MILIRRLIPFVVPVIVAFSLVFITQDIGSWSLWIGLIAGLVLLSHAHMLQWRLLTAEFWWSFVPVLLWMAGGVGYYLFIVSPVYQWLLIVVISIVYGAYMENVFTFYFQPQKYTHLSLPKLSYYMMIIANFFLFSFLFALDLINSVPWWVVLIIAPIVMSLVISLVFRGYAVLERKHWLLIFWGSIVALEAVWILQFLPTSYLASGAIMAVLAYTIPPMLLMVARDAMDKSAAIQYGVVALAATITVLATAQWV